MMLDTCDAQFDISYIMIRITSLACFDTKERLKMSKIAEFESDLLKTNEDIALQSREVLQTFVWWRAQT